MFVVADVDALSGAGVITREAARTVRDRSRETMMLLAINILLCGGILAATGGLVFWLKDALAVAFAGSFFLAAGGAILLRGAAVYRMFGTAATLIGAGILIGGAGLELADKAPGIAGFVMLGAGAAIVGAAAWLKRRGPSLLGFAAGAVLLMGAALHLAGGYFILDHAGLRGLSVALMHLYAAVAIGCAGWFVNVRFVTALAIVPFAQMLDTGTAYFHAAYAFYSPESTLKILQMGVLVAGCYHAAGRARERLARHLRIGAMMGFVVANLAALVGSLWGDVVGSHLWGPQAQRSGSWQERRSAFEAFRETALIIPDHVYAIVWAIALGALVLVTAHRNNRGLFNASLTFAGIHAYTQLFESFGDEPLAWVIGGLAAVPAAWSVWRINQHFAAMRAI